MPNFDWEEAETIRKDSVIAMINRAKLENGNVFHSIRISHHEEGSEAKPTQYLRPSDMDSLEALVKDVRYWIQADIDEIRAPKPR